MAKKWFASMGSNEIWNLGYRCGFVFIGKLGKKDAVEKRAEEEGEEVSLSQIAHFDGKSDVENYDEEL